jgi:hypothetical protein
MTLIEIGSHALTFLLGAATGAAGTYFADKYTDKRRRQEGSAATQTEFSKLLELMPDLLREMQQDFTQLGRASWREFYIIPKGAQLWPTPNSCYYEDDGTNNYLGKARILETRGYVIDVTPGNAPTFQMTEEFAALLNTKK